jgi:hypothetical protein
MTFSSGEGRENPNVTPASPASKDAWCSARRASCAHAPFAFCELGTSFDQLASMQRWRAAAYTIGRQMNGV